MPEPSIEYVLVRSNEVDPVRVIGQLHRVYQKVGQEEAVDLLTKLYPQVSPGAAVALFEGTALKVETDEAGAVHLTVTYEQDEHTL